MNRGLGQSSEARTPSSPATPTRALPSLLRLPGAAREQGCTCLPYLQLLLTLISGWLGLKCPRLEDDVDTRPLSQACPVSLEPPHPSARERKHLGSSAEPPSTPTRHLAPNRACFLSTYYSPGPEQSPRCPLSQ